MRLREYERGIDRDTGLPLDAAYDAKQPFIVHEVVNHAVKAREKVRAAAADKNKDKPGWDTGLHYVVEIADVPTPD